MASLLFSIYFQATNKVLIASFPDLTPLVFKTEKDYSSLAVKSCQVSLQSTLFLDKSL